MSSKEQIDGTSLQSQETACLEYARSKNINVLRTFREEGESAKFADRTELLELIDFCRDQKGTVQVLIVWKIDRFARNVADHFNIKATLIKSGVRIVSVTEPIDSNPEGTLMETILAGFAQFDNDIRGVRTVQGMRRKLQDGIFPWRPPLGYTSTTQGREKKTEPDRPVQPVFELLQGAWKRLATGTYTKAEIRRLLTAWGLVTKRGAPLSPQSTDKLFRNPYYAGILIDPWTGDEYEGKHQPMVTRTVFAQVQQALSRRQRAQKHQKDREEFPLRGTIRCPTCDGYLTASVPRGRSRHYQYYHCYKRDCSRRGKGLPAARVHDRFAEFLEELTPPPVAFQKLEPIIVELPTKEQSTAKARKERIRVGLAKVKKEIQEVIQLRTRHMITDQEMIAQKALLVKRRRLLESRLDDDQTIDAEEVRRNISEITVPLCHLRETWSNIPTPFRRRFQQVLIPRGFVHEQVGTAEKALLFSALATLENPNTTMVALSGDFWNRIIQEITDFANILRSAKEHLGRVKKRFQKNP